MQRRSFLNIKDLKQDIAKLKEAKTDEEKDVIIRQKIYNYDINDDRVIPISVENPKNNEFLTKFITSSKDPDAEVMSLKTAEVWPTQPLRFKISPSLVVIFLLSIVILFMFVFRTSPESTLQKQFDTLSKGFSIISVLMLVYIIYINVDYNSVFQENAIRNQSYKISKELYIDVYKDMVKDLPESYFILNSVEEFDERDPEFIEKYMEGKYNPDRRSIVEAYYSSIIIENFENFLTMKKYLVIEQLAWLMTYYYYFSSEIIQKYWVEWRDTYSEETNEVIEKMVLIRILEKEYGLSEDHVKRLLLNIKYPVY